MFELAAKNDFYFDLRAPRIVVDGKEIRLSPCQYYVLALVLMHPGITLEEMVAITPKYQSQTIRVSVSDLRGVLKDSGIGIELGYSIRRVRPRPEVLSKNHGKPLTDEERDNYEWQIQELRAALKMKRADVYWPGLNLTPRESAILAVLNSNEMATKEQLTLSIPKRDHAEEQDPKIVDVYICRLRQKMPEGVEIKTVWGRGYFVPKEGKSILAKLLEGDEQEEG